MVDMDSSDSKITVKVEPNESNLDEKLQKRHTNIMNIVSKLKIKETPLMINPINLKKSSRNDRTNNDSFLLECMSIERRTGSASSRNHSQCARSFNEKQQSHTVGGVLTSTVVARAQKNSREISGAFITDGDKEANFSRPSKVLDAKHFKNSGSNGYMIKKPEKQLYQLQETAALSRVTGTKGEFFTIATTKDRDSKEFNSIQNFIIAPRKPPGDDDSPNSKGLSLSSREADASISYDMEQSERLSASQQPQDLFDEHLDQQHQPGQQVQAENDEENDPANESLATRINDNPEDGQPEEIYCRICKSDETEGKLVMPCNCKGSIAYSHSLCLQKWIESKLTQSSLKCEICSVPYRVISHKRLSRASLVDFIKDPRNRRLNLVLLSALIIGIILLGGIAYSLIANSFYGEEFLKILHYILIGLLGISTLGVLTFFAKKSINEDWEFAQAPKGQVLDFAMVSKKNRWKIIVLGEQLSVENNQNQDHEEEENSANQ